MIVLAGEAIAEAARSVAANRIIGRRIVMTLRAGVYHSPGKASLQDAVAQFFSHEIIGYLAHKFTPHKQLPLLVRFRAC